jgi:hypothetical protein
VDERAGGFEHALEPFRDELAPHPMERLSERRNAEAPQPSRQVFGSKTLPAAVLDTATSRFALGLGDHGRIGIDSHDLLEQIHEIERHDARSAPNIEQPPPAVEPQGAVERASHTRRVREPPNSVERCAA